VHDPNEHPVTTKHLLRVWNTFRLQRQRAERIQRSWHETVFGCAVPFALF